MKNFLLIITLSLLLAIIIFNFIQIYHFQKIIFLPFTNILFYFIFFIIFFINYFILPHLEYKITIFLIILSSLFLFLNFFNYLNISDFKRRCINFFIIFLAAIFFNSLDKFKIFKAKLITLLALLFKKKFYLFLMFYIFYLFFSIGKIFPQIGFVGDEPHYLLITHSLVQDGDINLRNNYFNKDYLNYVNGKLRIQAVLGKKGASQFYSIHMPMISIYLSPFYWIGSHFNRNILIFIIRSAMSLIAAFLCLVLFTFLKKYFSEDISIITAAIYAFLPPLFFYSRQVYPETAAALLSLSAYLFLSKGYKILPALLSGLLPLFGSKYLAISAGFLAIFLIDFLKKRDIKLLLKYSFWFLFIFSYFIFLRTLYSYNIPFAQYHGETGKSKMPALIYYFIFQLDWRERIGSFFSYFLDQRDGLLPYTPIYFFSFLGMIWAWKKNKKMCIDFLLISLPYIGVYAFLTHRGGFCPPARPLVAISWIFPAFLAFFLAHNKNFIFKYLFYLSLVFSIFATLVFIKFPFFAYQATTHNISDRAADYFKFLSNFYFYLPDYFPSFLKSANSFWLPNYLWLFILSLFILFYFKSKKQSSNFQLFLSNNKFYLFNIFTLTPIFLYFTAVPQFSLKALPFAEKNNIKIYFFTKFIKMNNMNFNVTACNYYDFIIETKKPLHAMNLTLNMPKGNSALIKYFDKPIGTFADNYKISILLNKKYKAKSINYYFLTLRNISDTKKCNMGFGIDFIL